MRGREPDGQAGNGLEPGDETGKIRLDETQPGHARVELDGHLEAPVCPGGQSGQRFELAEVVDEGHDALGQDQFVVLGQNRPQKRQNGTIGSGLAQGRALGHGADGEGVRPGRGQGLGHGDQPMPVGVGLDHRDDMAAMAAQQLVVYDNGPGPHPGP